MNENGRSSSWTLTVLSNVIVRLEADGQTFEAPIDTDPLYRLIVARLERLITWQPPPRENDDPLTRAKPLCEHHDLRLFGRTLFRILLEGGNAQALTKKFAGDFLIEPVGCTLGDMLRKRLASTPPLRLNLVFAPGTDALARYPWEFMFVRSDADDGTQECGEDWMLSTTRLIKPEIERPCPKTPLRVWIAWSAPSGLGALLEIDCYVAMIKETLGNRIDVVRELKDVTWPDLQRALQEAGAQGPDVLHFIGHGDFAGGKSVFAFKRSAEEMAAAYKARPDVQADVPNWRWVDTGILASALRHAPPWLLFLQTCNSGRATDNADIRRGAAMEFASVDVPCVVAMQYEIASGDAKLFAETFYTQLGKGEPIDQAVKAGRLLLGGLYPKWGHPRFATPVVYLRANQATSLVLPEPAHTQLPDAQPCPYDAKNCFSETRQINSTLIRCSCEKYRRLKYCLGTPSHANRDTDDVTKCENRFCQLGFPPKTASASQPAPPVARAEPAAPAGTPSDKMLASP